MLTPATFRSCGKDQGRIRSTVSSIIVFG